MTPKSLLFYIFEHKKIDSSVCQPIFELEISAVMNDLVRQVYTFRLLECCPFLVNDFSAQVPNSEKEAHGHNISPTDVEANGLDHKDRRNRPRRCSVHDPQNLLLASWGCRSMV